MQTVYLRANNLSCKTTEPSANVKGLLKIVNTDTPLLKTSSLIREKNDVMRKDADLNDVAEINECFHLHYW